MKVSRAVGLVVAAFVVAIAAPAFAGVYPLEMSLPRNGMPANHRILKAYPGLEYNIRAAVVGGSYPYTYSLTNAPAGMTIDSRTGLIVWPNPTANATPTIAVVDSDGTRVTATWTITVTTTGFRFVNAAAPAGGNGTAGAPWRSIADMYANGRAGEFVYFRSGTYDILSLPRTSVGSPWERVEIHDDRPNVWLAYPGERPIINFGYNGSGAVPLLRFDSHTIYIDGFETVNSHIMGFQVVGSGSIFRRLVMHRHGPGGDGTNASMIMTVRDAGQDFMVIQDCHFYDSQDVMIKIYGQRRMLIEDNRFENTTDGIELKDDVRQFTVRGNTLVTNDMAIGGNMDVETTSGEILFNNVRANTIAQDVNQQGVAARVDVYRNTFVGRVQVRNVTSTDGPFTFTYNVIMNNDSGTPSGSHITQMSVSAPERVIIANNLVANTSSNMVDGNGNLTGSYAQYAQTHGHQARTGTPPPPGGGTPAPAAPTNVRIIR